MLLFALQVQLFACMLLLVQCSWFLHEGSTALFEGADEEKSDENWSSFGGTFFTVVKFVPRPECVELGGLPLALELASM